MNAVRRMSKNILIGLIVAAPLLGLLGCEDAGDDGRHGVRFSNESTRNVNVRTWDLYKHSDEFVLAPGDDRKISYGNFGNMNPYVYYDWNPKSTVAANQVDSTHVAFVDK